MNFELQNLQRNGSGSIREILVGQTLPARPERKWRHPWFTHLQWQATQKRWVATVNPGFVNGAAPSVRVTAKREQAASSDFGINPLSGKPYFSDPVFQQQTEQSGDEVTLEVPLYLNPLIALRWRAAGTDGTPDVAVPQYFRDRGVAPARQIQGDLDSGLIQQNSSPIGSRLLRTCDLILHQPREGLTSQIDTHPEGLATGFSIVSQTLGLQTPPPGDRLKIVVGEFSTVPGIDAAKFDYEESTWDETLIATVYLLSPPDEPEGSEPDGRWAPYVRHELFWNLTHSTPRIRWFDQDSKIPFLPPLAGGAAQGIVNFLVASINDGLAQTLNLITGESRAGVFYTATGGGHDANFPDPPTPVPAGDTGLDKGGRLQSKAALERAAERARRLDPPFPFRALPFDPATLLK